MALLAIIGHGSCVLWSEGDTFLVPMQHMYFQRTYNPIRSPEQEGSCVPAKKKTNQFKCMFVSREGPMPRQPFGQRASARIQLGGEHHERRLGARLDVHLAEREPRLVFRGALAARR